MDLKDDKSDVYENDISERLYEELYSKADILYFLVSIDGIILSCNITAQEKLGYDVNEINGKKFPSLFGDSAQNEVKKQLKTCIHRGYIKDFQSQILAQNKKSISVKINGLTQTDESGEPVTVRFYAKDTTQTQRAIHERQICLQVAKLIREEPNGNVQYEKILKMLQESFEIDGIGLFISDDERNPWFLKAIHNEEQGDLVGENLGNWGPALWNRVIHVCIENNVGEQTPCGSCRIDSVSDLILELETVDEKETFSSLTEFESLIIIPFEETDRPVGYFVAAHHQRSRWDADEIQFMEEIISIIPLPYPMQEESTQPVVLDDENFSFLHIPLLGVIVVRHGIIQSVNSWVIDFLGAPEDKIQGKPLLDFIAPEHQEAVLDLSRKSVFNDDDQRHCEAVVLTERGTHRLVDCAFSVLPVNGQTVDLWFWFDKEDKQRLRDQLIQARKMESLGMLAGGMVHDFNNLLACILGYSSLLSEEVKQDSPYYEDVKQIINTSEKATALTTRLTAYAQGGAYIVNDLDMNQLIREVAGVISRTLDKTVTIRAELDQNLEKIEADASQLQQAILQIVLNARDAMPNGGKILFQTRNVVLGENNAWQRYGGKPGRYIQIAISDTGKGISGDIKEKIFEPEFTTQSQAAGKGLGLAMVQDIIKSHEGFISVFSEKHKGTVFKIHLPISEKKETGSKHVTADKPLLGKETILLVDDEKVLRETARKMLTRYGYKVISAESGTEAVAIYKKYKDRIDLIILDTIMPGMRIDKVYAWLRKLNPRVKIIATSSLGEKNVIEDNMKEGILGHVDKPFQVRPLLRQVRSVLNA